MFLLKSFVTELGLAIRAPSIRKTGVLAELARILQIRHYDIGVFTMVATAISIKSPAVLQELLS